MSRDTLVARLRARVPWKLIRFAFVGGFTTVLYTVLASLFTLAFGWQAVIASVLAYLLCMLVSYVGHRRFTFRSSRPVQEEAHRFVALSVLGGAVAILSPFVLTQYLGLHPIIAILFVSIAVPALSFLGMERLVFRAVPNGPGGRATGSTDVSSVRIDQASKDAGGTPGN